MVRKMAAELPKFEEGALMTELKNQFNLLKTKKTVALAYGFIFLFIAFTIFLAFSPSANPSAPWFSNIFSVSINGRSNNDAAATPAGASPYGSQISSIYSHFFPNSDQQRTISADAPAPADIGRSQNNSYPETQYYDKGSSIVYNESHAEPRSDKVADLKLNETSVGAPTESPATDASSDPASAASGEGEKRVEEKDVVKNLTSSLVGKQSNGTGVSWKMEWVKSVQNCNLFDGRWVIDESYPLYNPGSCSLIDEQFNCFLNGRPDTNFHKLRWKPNGCHIPRLDGSHMLELLKGKRLVFVGDSLNRNMWESLICILRNSAKDPKRVYEASGRHHFRSEASYSFVFKDYDFTVEFFVSPFLVREVEYHGKDGTKKDTLRLDLVGETADRYKNADIIIFNTGHWWTHDKTSLGKDYYQEGSHVYNELNVLEAFRRAITTWSRWVDSNINPSRSLVFFRGYSSSHFSGGQWNSGGQCDHETEPIKNDKYLSQYPSKMVALEKILKNMKTPVYYLNVTRMTDYRKDGHPSIYRKQQMTEEERRSPLRFQDCSHWCLPGVPDSWNEILYAQMLVKHYQKQEENKKKS